MIRVALLDPHPIFRRGVRLTVDRQGDIIVVAEASNEAELWAKLATQPCDVLITEVSLGERNGLEVLPQIQALSPHTKVIVLTGYPPTQFAVPAFRAGAASYMGKDAAPDQLLRAIRAVAGGRRYVPSDVAEVLAAGIHSGKSNVFELLSSREVQVLRLYCSGKTITEISDATGMNIRTVSTHKTRILEKLNLHTNADLVAYAVMNNLIPVAVAYTQGDICASCAMSPFRITLPGSADPSDTSQNN